MKKLLLIALLCLIPSVSRATCTSSSTTPFSVGGTYNVVQYCIYIPTSGGDTNFAQFTQSLAAGHLSVVGISHCGNNSCNSATGPPRGTASDSVNGSYTCSADAAVV